MKGRIKELYSYVILKREDGHNMLFYNYHSQSNRKLINFLPNLTKNNLLINFFRFYNANSNNLYLSVIVSN